MTSSDSVSSTTNSDPAISSGRSVLPVGDEPAMRDWAAELVEGARSEGVELTGDNGLLTALVRQVLQTGLEVEMTDHLGYEPTPPKAGGRAAVHPHPRPGDQAALSFNAPAATSTRRCPFITARLGAPRGAPDPQPTDGSGRRPEPPLDQIGGPVQSRVALGGAYP